MRPREKDKMWAWLSEGSTDVVSLPFSLLLLSIPNGRRFTDALTFAESPKLFCDDKYGSFVAGKGEVQLENVEFPNTRNGKPVEEVFNLRHPCFSLNSGNNYKNQLADIFSHGKFGPQVCRRRCAHFVTASRPACGDRRPSPDWYIDKNRLQTIGRKWNCSDWKIPLTKKGQTDGIYLIRNYNSLSLTTQEDLPPPFALDNSSLAYLDQFSIHGLNLIPLIKSQEQVAGVEEQLKVFIERHPEITDIYYGNTVTEIGYFTKIKIPILKSSTLFDTLKLVPNLQSLMLTRVKVDDWEIPPTSKLSNLKAVSFNDVEMNNLPTWLTIADIQFFELIGTVTDSSNLTVLSHLPNLEHFILKNSKLTTWKSAYLSGSPGLVSLTIQCNLITSIEVGAFDHLTNLKYLSLAGNRLTNLPENILAKFDFLEKPSDYDSPWIKGFDEKQVVCPAGLKTTETILSKMPKIPNPGKIVALEFRGQKNFAANGTNFLSGFNSLEVLNIGKMGLKTLANLNLDQMCSLYDLNVINNPLNEENWLPDQIFTNLLLDRFRLGDSQPMSKIPTTLIALMRSSMNIMSSVPISLKSSEAFAGGCQYEAMMRSTSFQYKLSNENCTSHVNARHRKKQRYM
ncbi:unnamed protein product [Caenorhabditis auriculariae]|uniref:Uncharacterized protein n=1 Tax=Caenorhabditis auriculariae TaxID=2777116 RepID=A0A8S1HUL3_9PELO|nr:unnamed protein product [Caenorhabditis auriculariae]